MVSGHGHPYGHPRRLSRYMDIRTDICADIHVELSVLRTVRPEIFTNRKLTAFKYYEVVKSEITHCQSGVRLLVSAICDCVFHRIDSQRLCARTARSSGAVPYSNLLNIV